MLGAKETAEQCQSPAGGTGDRWRYKKQLWQQAAAPRSRAIPGALSRIQPRWGPQVRRGHGTAESTSRWVKSDGEGGNGWSGHRGVPSPALERVVLQLLEKPPSPPPWGVFLSRSRGGECHVYLNNINSLSSTYGLITGDPSTQASVRFVRCMCCAFPFAFAFFST